MHQIEKVIILDEESPIFSAQASETGVKIDIGNDLAYYILSCSQALTSVSSAMNKARLSLTLLNAGYLDAVATGEQSRSAFIEMLVENGIIRVQSIYDRVLILANRILDLGISNESINHNLLVTNENVLRFELEARLRGIHKACNEYRAIRNKVIHHDRFSEEEFDQLTLLINADHLSKESGGKQLINEDVLNLVIRNYLESKQEELGKYLDRLESKLFEFYDAVLPIYQHYKAKLRA